VRKLADYILDGRNKTAQDEPTEARPSEKPDDGSWNIIHVFTSFTTGFFVNLAYEKVLEIIRNQSNSP
jgi:hypothetical protein